MSFVMTYMRYKTDSLWPAVIFHMSHNAFPQKSFTPITAETGSTAWYADEFGLAVPVAAGIVALIYWRKGLRELPATAKGAGTT